MAQAQQQELGRKQTILDKSLRRTFHRLATQNHDTSATRSPQKTTEEDPQLTGVQITRLQQNMARRLSTMMQNQDPRRLSNASPDLVATQLPGARTPNSKSVPPLATDQFQTPFSLR